MSSGLLESIGLGGLDIAYVLIGTSYSGNHTIQQVKQAAEKTC